MCLRPQIGLLADRVGRKEGPGRLGMPARANEGVQEASMTSSQQEDLSPLFAPRTGDQYAALLIDSWYSYALL